VSNCICIDVDDHGEFQKSRLQRARKSYKCTECGDEIALGRLYEYTWGVWDGRQSTYRTCARCVNVRDEYFNCGWYWGQLAEHFMDWHDFDYRDGIPEGFSPCETKAPA
jgi:DNA-directed RNA polymerase subunit RPC12/RpoP